MQLPNKSGWQSTACCAYVMWITDRIGRNINAAGSFHSYYVFSLAFTFETKRFMHIEDQATGKCDSNRIETIFFVVFRMFFPFILHSVKRRESVFNSLGFFTLFVIAWRFSFHWYSRFFLFFFVEFFSDKYSTGFFFFTGKFVLNDNGTLHKEF